MHFLRKRPQSTLNFGELGLFSQQLHNFGIVSWEKIVFGVFPAISLTIQLCLGAQNVKLEYIQTDSEEAQTDSANFAELVYNVGK